LLGKTFERLTVVAQLPSTHSRSIFLCECLCGNYIEARKDKLKSGATKSCGCLQDETRADNGRKNKSKVDRKIRQRFCILKRKYGISVEEYNLLLEAQNFKCKICGISEKEYGKSFSVDHDHLTDRIRGLLCVRCNSGLGMFCDSIDLLGKAINYLNS
jgi:hypothetical protein